MSSLKEIRDNEQAAIAILGWSVEKVASSSYQQIKEALENHAKQKKEEELSSNLIDIEKPEEIIVLSGFLLQTTPLVTSKPTTIHIPKDNETMEVKMVEDNKNHIEQVRDDIHFKQNNDINEQQKPNATLITTVEEEKVAEDLSGQNDFEPEQKKCVQLAKQLTELLDRRLKHDIIAASLTKTANNCNEDNKKLTVDQKLLQQSLEQTNDYIKTTITEINDYAAHLTSIIQLKKNILSLQTDCLEDSNGNGKMFVECVQNQIAQLEQCVKILQKTLDTPVH